MRRVTKADVHGAYAGLREDGEASPRAGSPQRVRRTSDGDVGERNDDRGGVIGVLW